MANFTQLLQTPIGGNTVQEYTIALIAFVISLFIFWVFKVLIINRLKKLFEHTKNDVDDLIIAVAGKFGWPLYSIFALWVSFFFIAVPPVATQAVTIAALIIGTYYLVLAANEFINYGIKKWGARDGEGDVVDDTSISILGLFLKAALWIIAILLVISNLGYNISTLIAGLGIGGLAIAFALQKIFEDIFASFSIYFDKPFQTGDYIVVGEDSGIVKHIGIKSTRLQTLQGEELIISNHELTNVRVHNYKRMEERRVVFNLGVTYETKNAKLKKVPSLVEKAIKSEKKATFDRCHFKSFGNFSLNFEVVYRVNSSDYADYMDMNHDINLKIKEFFEKEKIDMAYPTQTVIVQK
ncbi:mechanosensitive ion channel [Candidatus Woesearchaeota archaeon]|nr:mechanosensitive ion channel [Candidatus Woesearchaeota archaeon]